MNYPEAKECKSPFSSDVGSSVMISISQAVKHPQWTVGGIASFLPEPQNHSLTSSRLDCADDRTPFKWTPEPLPTFFTLLVENFECSQQHFGSCLLMGIFMRNQEDTLGQESRCNISALLHWTSAQMPLTFTHRDIKETKSERERPLQSLFKCTIMGDVSMRTNLRLTEGFLLEAGGFVDFNVSNDLFSHSYFKHSETLNIIGAIKERRHSACNTWRDALAMLKVHNVAWIFSFPEKSQHAFACARYSNVPLLEYPHTMPPTPSPVSWFYPGENLLKAVKAAE